MIQRFDYCDIGDGLGHNWKEMKESEQGDFVLYEDCLAEIAKHNEAIESLLKEIHRLDKELAQQCDLARDAEAIANRQEKEIKKLTESLLYYVKEALKEQP